MTIWLALLSLSLLLLLPITRAWVPVWMRTGGYGRQAPSTIDKQHVMKLLDDDSTGCLRELYHPQRLDHFTRQRDLDNTSWSMRYFLHDCWWTTNDGRRGPIFFYAGNEGDVEMYVHATGLMWEYAQEFGAALIFAEHRYYGKSQPLGTDSWRTDPAYLTAEQALADYATLLRNFTVEGNAQDSPVIVFGGSFGGMLASWMRVKYPHLVAGAIAASAPIGAVPGVDGFRPQAFWEVVTRDAGPAAGAAPMCANMTRMAFKQLLGIANLPEGRATASRLLRLCKPLTSPEDVVAAAYWLQGAWDSFAMGNYPYPSSYINGDPDHPLPAYPMRAACMQMTKTSHRYASDLIQGLADAAGLLYNASGSLPCFDAELSGPAAGSTGPWDWQFCSEQLPQELPYFPATGVTDMFWDQEATWNQTKTLLHCQEVWGVTPDRNWAVTEWGGLEVAKHASNIVFSNGLLDPWSPFGVLENVSDSVVAVIIPEGAHHLDLMFSHVDDPPSVVAARKTEVQHIQRWISQHAANRCVQGSGTGCEAFGTEEAGGIGLGRQVEPGTGHEQGQRVKRD